MKKTISLFLTLAMLIAMFAVAVLPAGAAADDFLYEAVEGGIRILSYKGESAEVTIPSEIEGKPVIEIGKNAFYQNKTIESVTIPSTVKTIGAKAFAGSYVKSVTMADSVETLGEAAFKECIYLTDIKLSAGLTEISNNTFSFCTRLESASIPEGVTYVGTSAFQSCNHLKNISFPSTLEVIGEYAFAYTAIEKFNAPENLEKILSYAFFICDKLESVTFSENLKIVEAWAFANNYSLETVIMNDGLERIGDSAFDTTAIKEIVVPSSVTFIGEYAIGYTYDEELFDYVYEKECVIKCEEGTAAAKYAQDNGFETAPLVDPTEPPTETPTETPTEKPTETPTEKPTETPTEKPTEKPTETPTEKPSVPDNEFDMGDVNMDKTVNIKDATAIQKHVAGLITLSDIAKSLADYDADTRITVKDATCIQKLIAGLLK